MGEPRIIWLVRLWLIDVFWKQWYLLFFCVISPSWVVNLLVWMWHHGPPLPLRISWIWTFAIFWCLKCYYMIITDILWYDLHLNTPVIDHMPSMYCLIAFLPLPLLNMECMACMNFTTDTPLHHDSALTWNWTHKICTLCLWTRCLPRRSTLSHPRLEAKRLNAMRYVKIFCKFMNPTKHG